MGMISEISAAMEVKDLGKALRVAMYDNKPEVIAFCKSQLIPLFEGHLAESCSVSLCEEYRDVRAFFAPYNQFWEKK